MTLVRSWRPAWHSFYGYILLHKTKPERYPYPKSFWGFEVREGHLLRRPFEEAALAIGQNPSLSSVQQLLRLTARDTYIWLERRLSMTRVILEFDTDEEVIEFFEGLMPTLAVLA